MWLPRKKVFLFFLISLGTIAISPFVHGHVLKNSSSELKIVENQARWSVAVHEGDFDLKFKNTPEEVVKKYLSQKLKLKRGATFCALKSIDLEKSSELQRVYFFLDFDCENSSGNLTVLYNLFYGDWNHRHLARILWDGNVHSLSFSPQNNQALLSTPSVWGSLWTFFRLGLDHILVGYDHILFLLTLLLGARRFSHLIWLVTTFTVAHSISLALATLGYVQLGPQIVEPAIAASIVVLALLDFLTPSSRETRGMIPITFLFGLIHGLGFSGILKESGIQGTEALVPLISFNVGVEAGQVLIVGVLFGLLLLFKKKWSRAYPVGRKIILALIGVIGIYWLVTRI